MTQIYILSSVVIVSLLSLIGAALIVIQRQKLNSVIMYALAFSSGVVLGATFFDLLPEAVELLPESAFSWVLAGFVGFFALEKLIAWHHHVEGRHIHDEKPLAYLTLIGDGIHNFVDGAVIAGAYLVSIPLGVTTTLAVIAHEIPHELSDFMVLIHGGLSNKKALRDKFACAATAILGAIFVLFVSEQFATLEQYLVPIAAGNFLYIAASDLIPELLTVRKGNQSVRQIMLLIAGLGVVPLTGLLFGHV